MRSSLDFDNQKEEPNLLGFDTLETIRSFDASQYSDGHSVSSEENYFQLPDLDRNLPIRISSRALSVASHDDDDETSNSDQKSVQEQPNDELGDICIKVRCIESEDTITNTDTLSNPASLSPNRETDSNASSPGENTVVSGMTEVDNIDKENQDLCSSPEENTAVSGLTEVVNIDKENQDSCSPGLKERKELNRFHQGSFIPPLERISPWMVGKSVSSSRILKLTRSRSCEASLMKDSSSDWFDLEEIIQKTPPIGTYKDHIRRPEGYDRRTYTLNYNPNAERLSWSGFGNCVRCSTVDMQNAKPSFDMEIDDGDLSPVRREKKERESSKPPPYRKVCFNYSPSFICFCVFFIDLIYIYKNQCYNIENFQSLIL